MPLFPFYVANVYVYTTIEYKEYGETTPPPSLSGLAIQMSLAFTRITQINGVKIKEFGGVFRKLNSSQMFCSCVSYRP